MGHPIYVYYITFTVRSEKEGTITFIWKSNSRRLTLFLTKVQNVNNLICQELIIKTLNEIQLRSYFITNKNHLLKFNGVCERILCGMNKDHPEVETNNC